MTDRDTLTQTFDTLTHTKIESERERKRERERDRETEREREIERERERERYRKLSSVLGHCISQSFPAVLINNRELMSKRVFKNSSGIIKTKSIRHSGP